MRAQQKYTTDPKEAYAMQLRQIRSNMIKLHEILNDAIGEGVPDNVGWADVGDARKMNWILIEAVQTGL